MFNGNKLVPLALAALMTGCAAPGTPQVPAETASSESSAPAENAKVEPAGTSAASAGEAVNAVYPEQPGDGDPETFSMSPEYGDWWGAYAEKMEASRAAQEGMEEYYNSIMQKLLISDGKENTVCSPLNIYIAFAMLAETTDGTARDQILAALQAEDIGALRTRVKALWEANYVDTPLLKSLLADSMWLKDDISYEENTLKTLAEQYYASSFRGKMGSDEMNQALQKWTDDNTGGLLKEYTKGLKTSEETVLALISTIYYKAAWMDEFMEQATKEETFHGASGDAPVQMMHLSEDRDYYAGENFKAVSLPLTDSGEMTFFLPDEGEDVYELVKNPDFLAIAQRGDTEAECRFANVNLAVPKFKAEKKTDLRETMEQLGMKDVLTPGVADFSPLTREADDMYVSKAEHAALVETDEKGVTGAAYTALMVAETAALIQDREIVDIILDRPFAFTITGRDGSVLFAGVVQDI